MIKTNEKMNEALRDFIKEEAINLPGIKNKYLPTLIEDIMVKYIVLDGFGVNAGISEEIDIYFSKKIHNRPRAQDMNYKQYSNIMSKSIDRLYKKTFFGFTKEYSLIRNNFAHEEDNENQLISNINQAIAHLYKITYIYENNDINTPSFLNPFGSTRIINLIRNKWKDILNFKREVNDVQFKYITKEIIKEVPVTKYVNIIKEVPRTVVKTIKVEVMKEVPIERIVEITKEVPVLDKKLLDKKLNEALQKIRDDKYLDYFGDESEHTVTSSYFNWTFNNTPYTRFFSQSLELKDEVRESINSLSGFPGRISYSTFADMVSNKSIYSDFKASVELLKNKVNKSEFNNPSWSKAIKNAIGTVEDKMKFDSEFSFINSMTEYIAPSSKVHFDGNVIHFFNLEKEEKGYDFDNQIKRRSWIDMPLHFIKTRYGTGKVQIHFYTYDSDGNITECAKKSEYDISKDDFSAFNKTNRVMSVVNKLRKGRTPLVPGR